MNSKVSLNKSTSHLDSPNSIIKNSTWVSYGGNVLWIPVLALTGLGILFVYSASSVYSIEAYGNEFYFAKKQAFFLIPSLIAAFLGAKIPIDFYLKYIKYIFCFFLILTIATHFPHIGRRVGGAPRWLNTGVFAIQPSEFLKIFTPIFFVYLLGKNTDRNQKFINYFLLILGPLSILSQKDLGTTLVVVSGLLSILYMNGLAKRFFLGIFSILSSGLLLMIIVEPYRIARIMTFMNPFRDPLGSGFQVIQSFIAVANGGIFGRGIGESQQKLFFLPEAHTDFILAVITEEMGFLGVLILAILYGVLYYAILRLILCAQTHTQRLFATGFFTMMCLTTIINMGVVAGALPTKGLPLPFISNGGSALIANFFIIGILSQISKRTHNSIAS